MVDAAPSTNAALIFAKSRLRSHALVATVVVLMRMSLVVDARIPLSRMLSSI
ncbi:MAG: hypothetical protein ACJAZO_004140 [Myxococcota bacterium]|jgi:hypothetical protein